MNEKIEKELDDKQNEIVKLNADIDRIKEINTKINDKRKQMEKLLEEKENEIIQLTTNINDIKATNTAIIDEREQFRKTLETLKESQTADRQLLEQRNKEVCSFIKINPFSK